MKKSKSNSELELTAKEKLIRNKIQTIFISYELALATLRMKFIEDENIKGFGTDGQNIIYNPNAEINIYDICHMALHSKLLHTDQDRSVNKEIYNAAFDYYVANELNRIKSERSDKAFHNNSARKSYDAYKPGLCNSSFKGLTATEIYKILIADPDKYKIGFQGDIGPLDNHERWGTNTSLIPLSTLSSEPFKEKAKAIYKDGDMSIPNNENELFQLSIAIAEYLEDATTKLTPKGVENILNFTMQDGISPEFSIFIMQLILCSSEYRKVKPLNQNEDERKAKINIEMLQSEAWTKWCIKLKKYILD